MTIFRIALSFDGTGTHIFEQTESVPIKALIYDTDDTLTDPSSNKITINDPDATEVLAQIAMTKDSTGTYHYYYALASDATVGIWTASVEAATTDKTVSKITFKVIPKI